MKFNRLVVTDAHTLYPADSPRWNVLATVAEQYTVLDRTPGADVARVLEGADAVLTNKVPIDGRTMAQVPTLRYIGVLATGYNIVDVAAAHAHGITVCNVPAYSTASVAQTAIALLLSLVQGIQEYAQANAAGRWAASADFSYRLSDWSELAGKSIGIVGFGHTGSATAAIAAALGMKVHVYTSKPQEALPAGYIKTALEDIFRSCDVVSLHCPLTPETANMVNAGTLGMMKPGAILINTARGPLVDEQALAAALRSGALGGAGLDVMCSEPPQADNPLFGAPNCHITPHIAWASTEARQRLMEITLSNIRNFLQGEPHNVV